MPRRHQFYDPIIQEQSIEQPPDLSIDGIIVEEGEKPGVYLLAADVAKRLREFADYQETPQARIVLMEASVMFEQLQIGEIPEPPTQTTAPEPLPMPEPRVVPETYPTSEETAVYRVEIYPDDPEAERPRWIARTVDSTGRILYQTAGSFDQEYVISNAEERWPGTDLRLVGSASDDTVWEDGAPEAIRSSHSGRRRPSPNRLWPSS